MRFQSFVLILMALSISAANAIPTKQIPNKQKSTPTSSVKPAPSDSYREAGMQVTFSYQPPNPDARIYAWQKRCIKATITNLSKTKILKPDTDRYVEFSTPTNGDRGFLCPKIGNVRDNFGNSFKVIENSPKLMASSFEGIYPGEKESVNMHLEGRLIPGTKHLNFEVPEFVFGNEKGFEISVPVAPQPEPLPQPVSKPVDTNAIYTGPDLERIK